MPSDELSRALKALEGNDSPRFDQIIEFLELVSRRFTLISLPNIPDHFFAKSSPPAPSSDWSHPFLLLQAREARARLPEQVYRYGCIVLNKFSNRLGVDERKLPLIKNPTLIFSSSP